MGLLLPLRPKLLVGLHRIERCVEFGRRHWQQRAAVAAYSDLFRISAGQRIVQLIVVGPTACLARQPAS
jgi:hypothetical protein